MARPRALLVANVDWFFQSHFLPVGRALRDCGFDVWVASADTGSSSVFADEGLTWVRLPLWRKSANPLRELRSFVSLIRLYGRAQPALVHHWTIKPVIYGTLARSIASPRTAVVNTITGMSSAFVSMRKGAWLRRLIAIPLLRLVLRRPCSRVLFENRDDLAHAVSTRLVPKDRAVLVGGAGVDCQVFRPLGTPPGLTVMLAGRLLWEKGLAEFVEAARLLVSSGTTARFVIVGATDPQNLGSVPEAQIRRWVQEGVVEWWGHCQDMPGVLARASVVVLPSYSEGLPKVLLEAAACERPIVATDIPGCREIVRHEVNGLLVPPRDSEALSAAIQTLLDDPDLRERFGRAGREVAVKEFSVEKVVSQTLDVYRELLGDCWPETAT